MPKKSTYKDPYDPSWKRIDTPSEPAERAAWDEANRAKSVRPGAAGPGIAERNLDRLQTQVDKEKADRAKVVRASQSGFAQHLAAPDPMKADFDRVRQVGGKPK